MTEPNISLGNGASYVFPDSNVVLECKPLAELLWDQLGVAFPIVLVFVPQVLKEVDSKKHDGRIGKRAREFNRLLVQLVATPGGCMRLPNQDRDVFLAIGRPKRINWGDFADEDPDDGDTRVVLEVLNLPDIPVERAIFVSNDVKPLWIATRFRLKVHHAGDQWRRAIEPSPHDKEVQRLKQRVAELETSQPKLELEMAADLAYFKRFAVRPLSPDEGAEVIDGLRAHHPPPRRTIGYLDMRRPGLWQEEGVVTAKAYEEFEDKLPAFVERLPGYLEQEHGQFPFTVTVRNVGPLRAENLILRVSCSSGWLNDRPVLMPTRGTSPKQTRRSSPVDWLTRHAPLVHRPGRHEMDLTAEPRRSTTMQVQCEDFPSGQEWSFSGYGCIDPRSAQPFSISAQITAGNLHGTIQSNLSPDYEKVEVNASALVNLQTLEPRIEAQSQLEVKRRFQHKRYDDVEQFDPDDDD